jgi:diguanylate cyclase (GGDEF)-like protein
VFFTVIPEKCVGCLACARVCPAEAVSVDGATVTIIDQSCIHCGLCIPACPHEAIEASGDLEEALALARQGDAALILSVEAGVHFHPLAPEQVVNAAYRAGFRTVHRGVLGDELVAAEYQKLLADDNWSTMVRSTCPIVVEKVRREFPELVPYLAPVTTPIAAEAEYLRTMYGPDLKIVYAGVCVTEGDEVVDAVVTFAELAELFKLQGVKVERQPDTFERVPSERRRHLSTPGGLPLPLLQEEPQASRRFRKLRGLQSLPALAQAVVDKVDLGFVDILPCEGCLDHPLMGPKQELYRRRRVLDQLEPPRSQLPVLDPAVQVNVRTAFRAEREANLPPEREIEEVIDRIGRAPSGRMWDCGACGYRTCRSFAIAQVNGRATLRSCPPYQERRAKDALEQSAVDELTGLATFKVLRDRLPQEMARSSRSKDPFAVMFVDLDRFKRLNDVFGHEAGNRVLAAVGRELRRAVRTTDLSARYGGDEFVLILVRTGVTGSMRVGETLRSAIEGLGTSLGFPAGLVSASIGIATFNPRAPSREDLLEAADRALYRAKARGGNAVEAAPGAPPLVPGFSDREGHPGRESRLS